MAYTFLTKDLGQYRLDQFQTYADQLEGGGTQPAPPARDNAGADYPGAAPDSPTAPVTAPLAVMATPAEPPAPPAPPSPSAPVTAPLQPPPAMQASGGTPFQQRVYNQAAAVRDTTGVDPAIIATIASTETGGSGQSAGNLTLGIGTGAGAAGAGPMIWGNPTPEGGRQPSGFYAYNDGAQAAQAFRAYIERWQPALVPYLNDARAFFNPTGPITTSHYYVPTGAEAARAGGAATATANYYSNWQSIAAGLGGGAAPPVASAAPSAPDTTPAQSAPAPVSAGSAQVTTASPAAPSAPVSPLDSFQSWADNLDKQRQQAQDALGSAASSAVGQAQQTAGSAVDQFRAFADSLDRSVSDLGQAVGAPPVNPAANAAARQDVQNVQQTLSGLPVLGGIQSAINTVGSGDMSTPLGAALATAPLAGLVGEPGAQYDQYGVQIGQSHPALKVPAPGPYLEPEIAATLRPGSGPLAPAVQPQGTADLLQAMLDQARARGSTSEEAASQVQDAINQVRVSEGTAAASEPMIDVTAQLGAQKRTRYQPATQLKAQPTNPFVLSTEPAAGLVPMSGDEVLSHVEALDTQHAANDERIATLENQLQSGASTVVHPPGTVGWTNAEVIAYARERGLNPYSEDGWPHQPGDAAKIAAQRPRGVTVTSESPTAMRAELARLRTENEQIVAAQEHVIDNSSDATFYRAPVTAANDLPFDYPTETAHVAAPTVPEPTIAGPTEAAAPGARAHEATPPTRVTAAPPPRAPEPTQQPVDVQSVIDRLKGLNQQLERYPSIRYTADGTEVRVDPVTGQPTPSIVVPPANPPRMVKTGGEELTPGWQGAQVVPGNQEIPGRMGGAVPPGRKPPTIASAMPPPGEPPPPPGPPPVARAGITPETIDIAHQRIDAAIDIGKFPEQNAAAHAQLDRMLADGAAPDEITRFLRGQVERKSFGATSVIRTVRTGSMAGGLSTEGKVVVSPIIQTAMRAPVAAVTNLVRGRPQDIAAGLMGGIQGLAEGSQEGLQTLRYGTTYRAALTGGAQGGYGFAPGLDVMGKNVAQRVAGTAALGLVRTHGAVSDIAAGIGRGAALATGETPAAAAEIGQQWALRSGQYGTVGQMVADAFEGIRRTNPALDVVGQILVPFYRVGYNAFTQGVERSPVGMLGTAADVIRGRLPSSVPSWLRGPYAPGAAEKAVTPVGDRIANNLFGVGLAAAGFAQAAQGNITGEHPLKGDPKWSVRLAGQWVPLRVLGPGGEALAQSATLYEAARDGRGDIAKTAELAAAGYVGHVYDDTWLRSLGDVLGSIGSVKDIGTKYGTQATRELQYQGGSLVKSFIPQERLGEQVIGAVRKIQPPAPAQPAGRYARR